MYRYKVANFQNISYQQNLDRRTLREIRRRQREEERKRQESSLLNTGLMGLTGLLSLYQGGSLYRKGLRLGAEVDLLANDPHRYGRVNPYTQGEVLDILHKGRSSTADVMTGAALGLYGAYTLGRAGLKAIRALNNKQQNQFPMQYDPYNPYNQFNTQRRKR